MATQPTSVIPGVFDVHIDTQFTLDGDTAELDAYAIKDNGSTALAIRYAQLVVPYTGTAITCFVDSRKTEEISQLPAEIQEALTAIVAEATDHQQRGRTLIEP